MRNLQEVVRHKLDSNSTNVDVSRGNVYTACSETDSRRIYYIHLIDSLAYQSRSTGDHKQSVHTNT